MARTHETFKAFEAAKRSAAARTPKPEVLCCVTMFVLLPLRQVRETNRTFDRSARALADLRAELGEISEQPPRVTDSLTPSDAALFSLQRRLQRLARSKPTHA